MERRVESNWRPPNDITKKQWERLRKQSKASPLRTFAGYAKGWGGQFYASKFVKDPKKENLVKQAKNALLRARDSLKGVRLYSEDYRDLDMRDVFIYADPPYANTTGYYIYCLSLKREGDREKWKENCSKEGFDSDAFWDQVRKWTLRDGNVVVVSELKAPPDFVVWEKFPRMGRGLNPRKGGKAQHIYVDEKLFIHKSLANRLKK